MGICCPLCKAQPHVVHAQRACVAGAQALGLGESHSSFKVEKEADEAEKAFGGVNLGFSGTRLITAK